jgi:hypothetical protein
MARWPAAPRRTTKQRGYSGQHQKLHAQWKPAVDAGQVNCHATICVKPTRRIQPGTPWHLGHTTDRTSWTGPEHEQCSIADRNRRYNQARRQPPAWTTSRAW